MGPWTNNCFENTIRPGESDGLEELTSEIAAIKLPPETCAQEISDPVALFADAARVRVRARAVMEALATQARRPSWAGAITGCGTTSQHAPATQGLGSR